jgi:Fic family protein
MEKSTAPETRSEQAIAGYRDVLNTIHTRHADIEFSTGVVRQFHRDLFKYTSSRGGDWKSTGNDIIEEHPDGTEVVRFETVPAHRTPEYMESLHERFDRAWREGNVDPLLLIAAYVLDFLCIHPFRDGNGRMARLLTLLLLYKADYGVGQYISLEKLVEDSRESYYDALYQSSQGWHEAEHSLHPWTDYFLGTLLAAYEAFEDRVGDLRTQRGAKTQRILDAVEELPDGFKTRDVEELCPSVSRSLIRKVFDELKEQGKLRAEGRGPAAVWRKLEN